MKQRKAWITVSLMVGGLLVSFVASAANGAKPRGDSAQVQVKSWGPSEQLLALTKSKLKKHRAVRAALKGARYRLLSFELLDDDKTRPPNRYEATLFDYTNNRAYLVSGRFGSTRVTISSIQDQPMPSEEEFEAAVRLLKKDPVVGAALREGKLTAYQPMPPLVNEEAQVGETERTIAVGLVAAENSEIVALTRDASRNEIVGVNLVRSEIQKFDGGAPVSASAVTTACGPPSASQATAIRSTSGSYNVIIKRGGVELWNLIAVRPSISSGKRGSGLELRNVRYRKKSVLARAHVPILNVQYIGNACGPYRDWQWQEGYFNATGTTVAPSILKATSMPTTMVDTQVDRGNFRGVAFYDDGQSVVLVTEMQAGWYRYVMKWILKDDGTIQPRFGFGGVRNSCICNIHNHHAYWRFDFDMVQAAGNAVCKSAAAGQPCVNIAAESKLASVGSYLEIRNTRGLESYRLTPGTDDGKPDAYSKASAWVLSYLSTQLDDGVNCTAGSSCHTDIDIDKFVNGQSVQNADIVVWYRSSFVHDELSGEGTVHAEDHGGGSIVGPELKVVKW